MTIDRMLVAETARLVIEAMQQSDARYKTALIDRLVESFRRIEASPNWSAEEAFRDYWSAMSAIATSESDRNLMQENLDLHADCSKMFSYLVEVEGAGSRSPALLQLEAI